MDGKHMHGRHESDREAEWIPIPREMWERYEDDRDQSRGFPVRELQDRKPLFYLLDAEGKLVFFGPTMMFRLPYPHTVGDLIPKHLQQLPAQNLDLAEAIFGTVSGGRSVKRVFVEDAPGTAGLAVPRTGRTRRRTPYILGTPKPTAFQHYLVQPGVKMEDGTFRPAGADPRGRTLCTYHHPVGKGPFYFTDNDGYLLAETDGTVIRGTKCYWHQPKITDRHRFRQDLARPDETQLTIIRPVRPGTVFKGRLRFENLSDIELGALLTVLQLKPTQRHRLGMGKPFGMGSVKIDTTLHLTDRAARYATLFAPTASWQRAADVGDVGCAAARRSRQRCGRTTERSGAFRAARR
jgi:CRISPR-associated protein (TIGR03986 family)